MNMLTRVSHYACALHSAIGRQRLVMDGLEFARVPGTAQSDPNHTGAYSQEFQLIGTGKRYRVTVMPTPQSHQ